MRIFRNWNKWVTLGGMIIAVLILGLAALLVYYTTLQKNINPSLGQAMTTIPAKTFTPTITDQINQPTSSSTPLLVDGIRIGMYVQIRGTGGSGLRIRSAAGLNTSVNFLGLDDEVFYVKEGPVEQDGYTWWLLVAPYDETRNGWAASDFLEIVAQ